MTFAKTNDEIVISKATFRTYLKVQKGGLTNMFDIGQVMRLSGGYLTRAQIVNIMRNYKKYEEFFGINMENINK